MKLWLSFTFLSYKQFRFQYTFVGEAGFYGLESYNLFIFIFHVCNFLNFGGGGSISEAFFFFFK